MEEIAIGSYAMVYLGMLIFLTSFIFGKINLSVNRSSERSLMILHYLALSVAGFGGMLFIAGLVLLCENII